MKDRIHAVMTRMGLSQKDFAEKLGMTAGSISGIFNGRTNPTINHVIAVHNAFPTINEKWLLFGEGEMFVGAPAETSPVDEPMDLLDDDQSEEDLGGFFSQPAKNPTQTPQQSFGSQMSAASAVPTYNHPTVPSPVSRQTVQRTPAVRETQIEIVKNIDKPLRRVKEIRVFYDDNTYETFVPAVK